jgi:hypothetical protein
MKFRIDDTVDTRLVVKDIDEDSEGELIYFVEFEDHNWVSATTGWESTWLGEQELSQLCDPHYAERVKQQRIAELKAELAELEGNA